MVQTTVDVLIIGAGPTGTTLALELAAQNIPFRLVDKALERSDRSRALAVQSRTLEVLNRHAPVQDLTDSGSQVAGGVYYIHGKQVADLDLSNVRTGDDTAFPQTLNISQSDTEQFLDRCLAEKYGRSAEFGVEAASIVQDADGVTVTLRNVAGNGNTEKEDAEEVVRAKYVVGADGAHSLVRHAAQSITFDGSAYPQDFILCDAHLRDSRLPRDRLAVCWGDGLMTVFPLRDGMVRVVASRPGHHADDADEPVLADFQAWFDRMAPGSGELHDPFWMARFRLHHRVASGYREGRLFLAGDAAHIHSPAGAFLDSYNAERRPVGERLLRSSDRLFSIVASNSWLFRVVRNLLAPWLLPLLYRDEARRNSIFRFLSQLGVRYRRSAIVGTAAGFSDGAPVRGGDRAPDGMVGESETGKQKRLHQLLAPASHHLLLFSGVAVGGQASEADLARAEALFRKRDVDAALVHTLVSGTSGARSGYADANGALHKRFGMEKTAGYAYIRPDGYIAHIGPLSSLEEFMDWQ
ncbi:6-methylpretetramide 4-monooxygenase [Apiospora aurea]|uniref:6-methylpretetramide 4-monooxygenase n=1 Tax=Apiospora aurea TaxID=335848 RepID=A0ABR1QKE7_9PEZI